MNLGEAVQMWCSPNRWIEMMIELFWNGNFLLHLQEQCIHLPVQTSRRILLQLLVCIGVIQHQEYFQLIVTFIRYHHWLSFASWKDHNTIIIMKLLNGSPFNTLLQYVCRVSEVLKSGLEFSGIRVVVRQQWTLRKRLVHPKDIISQMERSCMECCIPCGDCPATYVGETKRKLGKRVDEHKRALQRADSDVSLSLIHIWRCRRRG